MTEKLVTRKELAEAFGCSVGTIRRWEQLGKLKSIKLARGTVRYKQSDVAEFLAAAGEVREICAKP